MTRRTIFERMLEKYGGIASIGGNTVRAILRPLQYKSGTSLNVPTEYYDNVHTLYTGPVSQKLCIGDEVSTAARDYVVKRADTAEIGGEELYVWAVLKALAPNADKEVYLEADGKRAAVIDGYAAKCVQQSREITAWGEQNPVGTVPGRIQYELTLKNVRPAANINLYCLTDFNLIAARTGERVVYSGCRWKSIASSGGAGNSVCRTMELVAAKRTQVKEGENNGQQS